MILSPVLTMNIACKTRRIIPIRLLTAILLGKQYGRARYQITTPPPLLATRSTRHLSRDSSGSCIFFIPLFPQESSLTETPFPSNTTSPEAVAVVVGTKRYPSTVSRQLHTAHSRPSTVAASRTPANRHRTDTAPQRASLAAGSRRNLAAPGPARRESVCGVERVRASRCIRQRHSASEWP